FLHFFFSRFINWLTNHSKLVIAVGLASMANCSAGSTNKETMAKVSLGITTSDNKQLTLHEPEIIVADPGTMEPHPTMLATRSIIPATTGIPTGNPVCSDAAAVTAPITCSPLAGEGILDSKSDSPNARHNSGLSARFTMSTRLVTERSE